MRAFNYFPWRIFFHFFIYQLLGYNILFLSILSVVDVRYAMPSPIYNELLLNFFFFSLLLTIFTSYRFSRPIRRMIRKAVFISSKKNFSNYEDLDDQDILNDDGGQYYELDVALNRIQRKMKKRKEQLVREREESQAFMSSVQEGLISISIDEKVLYFNSQFAAQFLDPEQMNSRFLSLKDIFRLPDVLEGFENALSQGKVQRVTVRLNTRLDNQARFFVVSMNPLRKVKSREVYGAIGIFHDITELKKADQVRIDFVGNASHELRTPLTSVKGYVETLREDIRNGSSDHAERFLEIISRNVDRLIDLVNDLLSLSSLESNSELKIEAVDPLQISEHVISEMILLASEKKQIIRVIGDVSTFMADASKVEQVLRNLVSNAVKYIPEGKNIQIRWESDDKDQMILRVIDDGPGIPEEHRSRLFERFYRVDKGRTRDAGGTGLGLAIVKHIMQNHGGSVVLKSAPDQGCEFICTFPRKR